eukprot:2731758-Pleurochrysis_carterae.AAC.2
MCHHPRDLVLDLVISLIETSKIVTRVWPARGEPASSPSHVEAHRVRRIRMWQPNQQSVKTVY